MNEINDELRLDRRRWLLTTAHINYYLWAGPLRVYLRFRLLHLINRLADGLYAQIDRDI